MSKTEKLNEEQVFKQAFDDDELETVAGGDGTGTCGKEALKARELFGIDSDTNHCVNMQNRDIYEGGFPNCAATVEDRSWCGTNDACHTTAVDYKGMTDCSKAHA